ncbi:MAG: type I methionyl aminopeptidase [Ornithinimicrobium sp.]
MSLLRRPKIEAKTESEVRAMRAAGVVVAQTLRMARDWAAPGETTASIDARAEHAIRDAGATPSFLGYQGFSGSLCISVNDEVVHGVPGSRVLTEGDLVSIDCGAIVDGWHGDAALTLVVGGEGAPAARPEDLAVMHDTEAALWAGIRALRAGRRLYAVGDAVEQSVTDAQVRRQDTGTSVTYGIVEEYVGHGIGTSMHMDPHVPNYAVRGKGPTVPVGATLAIEPMVTLGGIGTRTLDDDWTVVTLDGTRAAHWEHTVAVTNSGLWVLTAEDGGRADLGEAYAPLD